MSNPFQNIWGEPQIGKDCKIAAFVEIGRNVIIGDRVSIQARVTICPWVTIEDDVFIGAHTVFTNDKHPPSDKWAKTLVKKGAVIGAQSTILPGIIIGRNAKIGAGSVVTKNVPYKQTWVGNPAHNIRNKL